MVVFLEKDQEIKTKAKKFVLKRGYYVYVGSAMNSLEGRILRHFRQKKRFHWHIDYLLDKARIIEAYLIPSNVKLEEDLSMALDSQAVGVDGFGASDVSTKTNLYYFGNNPPGEILYTLLNSMGLKWKRIKNPQEIMEWRENDVENWKS